MTNNIKTILNLLPLSLVAATAAAAEPQKNIVLILADDLGWADTTLYGKTSLHETPNIRAARRAGHDLYQCVRRESNLLADRCQHHVWPECRKAWHDIAYSPLAGCAFRTSRC